MNIEGVVRQLPLFEPPIDPALLVAAGAAGVIHQRGVGQPGHPRAALPFRIPDAEGGRILPGRQRPRQPAARRV